MYHCPTGMDHPLILLVDDDDVIRTAIEELLLSVGLDVQGFASPRAFLEAELPDRPGCLLLDVRMPGMGGLDVQRHLRATGNTQPIIFLTGHADVQMTVEAMKAGALDFLTKPVRDQALLDAVTLGIERDRAERAETHVKRRHVKHYATLTPRERQVFGEVAKGQLNKQIAYTLGISEVTVKLHRGGVMRKMGAISVGDLVRAWEALPLEVRQ